VAVASKILDNEKERIEGEEKRRPKRAWETTLPMIL
jgi:hypothetical protein